MSISYHLTCQNGVTVVMWEHIGPVFCWQLLYMVSPLNGDSCAHICVSYFSDRTVFPTLPTLCRCVSYFSDRIVFPTLPSLVYVGE